MVEAIIELITSDGVGWVVAVLSWIGFVAAIILGALTPRSTTKFLLDTIAMQQTTIDNQNQTIEKYHSTGATVARLLEKLQAGGD